MVGSRVWVVAAAALLSGCASARTRSELSRTQSQVGLLDERVTQLERAGIGGGFSDSSSSESSLEAAPKADETTIAPSAPPGKSPSVGKKSSSRVASSLKPSTREIQQALKNAGFYQGTVDGKSGPMTRDAIKEFQRVHGLTDDGVVGKQTWAKLQAYSDLSSGAGEVNAAEVLK